VTPPDPVDGASFAALLVDPDAPWRDAVLLELLAGKSRRMFEAVRTARYVYAEYANGDRELYDLALDPWQLENAVLNPAYAGVVADMRARLDALRQP